ncbi:MAG: hypothetical protein C0459_04075 [Chitinophaga sp.]|jgi:Domain of unknown function (DUF1735)|nr:hypothetical protein [Chitinophaga sp.]
MKIINTRLLFGSMILLIVSLNSCIKDVNSGNEVVGLQPFAQIVNSGIGNFGSAALTFPPADNIDTAWFLVNFAATGVAPTDQTYTLSYDANALAAYNASSSIKYSKFPDSTASFTTTSVTIKAGQSYSALVPFIVKPSKIDPTQSYMFPISITATPSGINTSSNFNTIYYHVIGNPLAGPYTDLYTRWNNASGTGSPSAVITYNVVGLPDDPNTFELQAGYGTQGLGTTFRYVVSFTGTSAATATNFQVTLNSSDVASIVASGFAIGSYPTIILADGPNRHFKFTWSVINSAGAPRTFTDEFTHQ